MSVVAITGISYDADNNLILLQSDFSALDLLDPSYPPELIALAPEAIGNRIAVDGYTDGAAALDAIVLEHAARLAPGDSGVTVDWQSPSDQEKATQLDQHADAIEAARVFFSASS